MLAMRLAVRPYGVLGSVLTKAGAVEKVMPAPPPGLPIVDPAGLPFIQNGPRGAGTASGEIYRWLGIADDDAFPEAVRAAITAPLQAKLHFHAQRAVIHVVGPDFRGRQARGEDAYIYRYTLRSFI